MGLPERKGIFPPADGWKPQTYYAVNVAFNHANPVHRSLFFSGFLHEGEPAGYACVLNPSYDGMAPLRHIYFLEVVAELGHKDSIGE